MNVISQLSEISKIQDYLGGNIYGAIPENWSGMFAMGAGKDAKPGSWKPYKMDLLGLITGFTEHKEGAKDGISILQGSNFGGARAAVSMETLYIIGVDIDNGTPTEELDAKIAATGLFCIRYTTHSHGKSYTDVKQTDLVKFTKAKPNAGADAYLIQKKRFLPDIAAGATVGETIGKKDGLFVRLHHQAMDKNRLIFILKHPWSVTSYGDQKEAITAWGRAYVNFCLWLGVDYDQSCTDPSRLFYTPRYEKGSSFGSKVHQGKAIDIFALPSAVPLSTASNVYLDAAADMGISDGGGEAHSLKRWAAKSNSTFLLAAVIEANAPEKFRPEYHNGDKLHIECPFEDEHTTPGGGGTYVVDAGLSTGGGFVVHCRHNSCCDRDRLDFVQKMIDDKWFDASAIEDPAYHLELSGEEQAKQKEGDTGQVGFFHAKEGVKRRYINNKEEIKVRDVCSPLFVEGRTRGIDNRGWGKLLRWIDPDGQVHYWAMPSTALATGTINNLLEKLANEGVEWNGTPTSRADLQEYLSKCENDVKIRCTDKSGWFNIKGSMAFLVGDTAIGNTPERLVLQSESASAFAMYGTSGSLQGWQDGISKMALGNSRLTFGISTAFAGPLVKVLGEGAGGFHFRGESKLGKTPLLYAAASVFGPPDKYSMTWRATDNGLEGACVLRNDGVMILDEIGQADANKIGDTVYMVLNGAGKVRAGKDASARDTATWTCLLLSSGEISLAEKMGEGHKTVKAGQTIRMVDISADAECGAGAYETTHGKAFSNFCGDIYRAAAAQHGHAGREYLKSLTDELETRGGALRDELGAQRDEWLATFAEGVDDAQAKTVAIKFALVAVAGELATRYGVTGWATGEAAEAAGKLLKVWLGNWKGDVSGNGASLEQQSGVEAVRKLILQHGGSRFEDAWSDFERGKVHNRLGWKKIRDEKTHGTEDAVFDYLIPAEVWANEVCKGHDVKVINKALVDAGMLERGAGGKCVSTQRIPDLGRVSVYRLKAEILSFGQADEE